MFYYRLFRRLEIKSKKIVNKTNICIDYNDNYIQYFMNLKENIMTVVLMEI